MASGDQHAFLQPKDFSAVNGGTPFPSWSRSRLVSGDSRWPLDTQYYVA